MTIPDRDLPAIEAHLNTGAPLTLSPRKKRNNEESRAQQAVVKWFRYCARGMRVSPLALMSFPNGGYRSPITASILKAEGAVRGAPDLFVFVPRSIYHGMAIEMKAARGVLSPEQEAVHAMLRENGYCVVVCRSFDEAKKEIESYLL